MAPVLYFLCAKEMRPVVIWGLLFWCSFADSDCAFCAGCQLRLRMLRSGMMHRGCGRPVRTLGTFLYDRAAPMAPVLYFWCAKQMTPIIVVACFLWCSFADSGCAFCAGCQLRLHMLRSAMIHRGCGRAVRTLRTFCDDRAAPSAPLLYFLCAKQMTPVIWWPAFGAPSFADSDCAFCAGCQLRLRMLRSGMMHRGCGRPVRTLRTFCYDRAAPMAPVLYVCVRSK